MAGEERILEDIQYNNYIYLFNDPCDIVVAKKRTFAEGTNPGTTPFGANELKLFAGKPFRQAFGGSNGSQAGNFVKNLIPSTIETSPVLTAQALSIPPGPRAVIFQDGIQGLLNTAYSAQSPSYGGVDEMATSFGADVNNGLADFPSLFSQDLGNYKRVRELGTNFVDVRGANVGRHNDFLHYKFTNDFGYNPKNRHTFVIDLQNEGTEASVYYEYQTTNITSMEELTFTYSYQIIPQKLSNQGPDLNPSDIEKAKQITNKVDPASGNNEKVIDLGVQNKGPFLYNILDAPENLLSVFEQAFTLNDDSYKLEPYTTAATTGGKAIYSRFTFTQKLYFGIEVSYADQTIGNIYPLARRYFDYISTPVGEFTRLDNPKYGGSLKQLKYTVPYNSQFKLIDNCCTKIGVPYDTRTVTTDKVDLKTFGVRATAPTYESSYNYYDPQYEPVVISIINQGIIDENSLPSVYDFVYLSKQENLMKALLDLPYTNNVFSILSQNTTLSNLNRYLDTLSVFYRLYIRGYQVALQDADPSPTPLEIQNLVPMTHLDDLPGMDTATFETSNDVFHTTKSDVLKQIETAGLDGPGMAAAGTGESFVSDLIRTKGDTIPQWLEELKKGIYFSEKSMPTFNQGVEFRNRFPFASTINIPQEQRGPIANIFSENGLLDAINTHAASLVVPNEEFDRTALGSYDGRRLRTYSEFYGGMINADDPSKFNMFNGVKLKTFRMNFSKRNQKDFLRANDSIIIDDQEGEPSERVDTDLYLDTFEDVGLETPKNVLIYSGEESTSSTTTLLGLLSLFKSKKLQDELIDFFADGGVRGPKEIQEGKFAHQETLMYEIAKYEIVQSGGSSPQERYIQSIFLPIVNQDTLSYVDTQVIPYKNYFYKIFAHKVIVGTRYKLGDIEFEEKAQEDSAGNTFTYMDLKTPIYRGIPGALPDNNILLEHYYLLEPYLQFVRVPYYNTPMVNTQTDAVNFTRVEDLPPTPPEVQVIPYRNVKNKILFLLNNSTGDIKSTVIPISDTDLELFDSCAISQGVNLPSKDYLTELRFKSDDIPKNYTLFRMEKRPSSYKEFSEDADAVQFSFSDGQSSFVDNILPNKDYYYCFRTTDIHGKISNPTIVYKVRIISEISSAPYVKIETFDPLEESAKIKDKRLSVTKTFQKYLLLGLNRSQNTVTYPNMTFSETGAAQGDYFSQPVNVDSAVFGKKYKLRITSKQTGRKIDINIDFKNPKNIINNV